MLYCKNCRVRLPGSYRRCPLCQGDLSGEADENGNVFPTIPLHTDAEHALMVWLSFCSIAAAAVCTAVNLVLPSGGWWFLFVIGGIGSFWISLILVLKKRKNIPKTILWQVGVLSILAYVWDRFTGFQGWSLNYVLPILCTSAMVAMSVIARARKLDIQSYIFYLIIDCVFGILSFILLVMGKVAVMIPSAICFASTIIFLAALLLFEGKALFAEIQRRFHL
ncbi:hypothetical protein EQM14_11545 [Caproiciproducens sp. NJN-50]|uniref:DUF6320 domain-containing protein n=1 Tax=Acutalibacteraceae TaxID=3082771 RepID=UPI000FFE2D3E|nr:MULTISPECIES: DUF6320 domain-containing protein [Acutalibacteraceae]QAT50344.1 hypothetical protein EQM14_11545 [Caproiciproducens sp. NJN-50]